MSLLFNGTSGRIDWSIGGVSLTAYTMVELIKLNAGVSWQGFVAVENGGTHVRGNGRNSSGNQAHYSGGGINTQTGAAISSSDGWFLNACKRPAGTGQTVRFLKYPQGGSPTWTDSGGVQDNPLAHDSITFGQVAEADWFAGRLAVVAIYSTNLSDSDIESLLTNLSRPNWLSKSNCVFLADELDAFTTDYAGTSTRTAIAGTSDDADDPSGWNNWSGLVTPILPTYRAFPKFKMRRT